MEHVPGEMRENGRWNRMRQTLPEDLSWDERNPWVLTAAADMAYETDGFVWDCIKAANGCLEHPLEESELSGMLKTVAASKGWLEQNEVRAKRLVGLRMYRFWEPKGDNETVNGREAKVRTNANGTVVISDVYTKLVLTDDWPGVKALVENEVRQAGIRHGAKVEKLQAAADRKVEDLERKVAALQAGVEEARREGAKKIQEAEADHKAVVAKWRKREKMADYMLSEDAAEAEA